MAEFDTAKQPWLRPIPAQRAGLAIGHIACGMNDMVTEIASTGCSR